MRAKAGANRCKAHSTILRAAVMLPEYVDIPIFPLPNVTFFPQTVLPLHVFEPRYVEMVANCLRGDKLMGVALLREGWQKDYFGQPPIYKNFRRRQNRRPRTPARGTLQHHAGGALPGAPGP